MKFCSACGLPLAPQLLGGEMPRGIVCQGCQTVHYQSPKILVACIVYCGDRILMCRRAQEPSRGRWTIPAGFMEEGETIEQTAARETKEETGVDIDPNHLDLYGVLSIPHMNEVYLTLRTELTHSPRLIAGQEALDVAMIGEHDIAPEDWAFASELVKEQAEALFREIRSGVFGIHKMSMSKRLAKGYETRVYAITGRATDG
jgi:ADP-ribose pyrophosphatase YjhB (NUDIX family)